MLRYKVVVILVLVTALTVLLVGCGKEKVATYTNPNDLSAADTQLLDAAMAGDLEGLKKAINDGADVNSWYWEYDGEEGYSALDLAA